MKELFYNFLTIWTPDDFLFISFLLLIILIVIVDIVFRASEKIAYKLNLKIKHYDLTFILLFTLVTVLIYLDYKIGTIASILGIVEYTDGTLTIFRDRIVMSFISILLLLSISLSFVCGVIAFNNKMNWKKWFIYGLFFNILSLMYLLHILKKEKAMLKQTSQHSI